MPGSRIPALTAISGANTANDDDLVIFDTTADTTKRISRSQLAAGLVGDLPYTPAGGISATTIPTAIAELTAEKPHILANIAALQAFNATGSLPTQIQLTNNYVAGDGGGGFRYDSTDTTTADNGGTVIVDAAGRRWKRQYDGAINVRWFGARGDDATNDAPAFVAAIAAVVNDNVVLVPPGVYRLTSALTIGEQNKGARVHGVGQPTLKFASLASNADCMVLNGYNYRQIELRNLIIDCNATGRDGIVLNQSNYPVLSNVRINNSYRDAFAIVCDGYQWVENGEFHLMIEDAGRHAVRQQLSGSNGAFINECLWLSFEVRRCGKITAGGQAMRMTSTATLPASKFSNQIFLKTNLDCQYDGTGPAPSLNIFEIDSGNIENWRFLSGGFENTSVGATSGGYTWAVSGTGVWIGLTVDSTITNSLWGELGAMSSIQHKFIQYFSFNYTQLDGTLIAGATTVNLNGARLQSANGLTFPAVQAAIADSNTLDDYEEGLWTPIITNGTTNVTSYYWQRGYYLKIGKRVFIELQLSINVVGITSGDIKITGLPFALTSDPALGSQTNINFLGQKASGLTTGVWSGTVFQTAPTEIIPYFPSTYGTQITYTELASGGQWHVQGSYTTTS